MTFRDVYRFVLPEPLRRAAALRIDARRQRLRMARLKSDFIRYYDARDGISTEEAEAVAFIRTNGLAIFPYNFTLKYDRDSIEVHFDDTWQLPFVLHGKQRLYFKRDLSVRAIKSLYRGLQLDQDPDSPHRYLTGDFRPGSNDIIADCGAAEGNFTLSVIESMRHAYLFEPDSGWVEALTATFAPWKEKVSIVPSFIGKENTDGMQSLDSFILIHEPPTFIKVDIEGYEKDFLDGASGFLSSANGVRLAICTYHKKDDEVQFTDWLTRKGFSVAATARYMMFYFDEKLGPPYLRRGLLRASR